MKTQLLSAMCLLLSSTVSGTTNETLNMTDVTTANLTNGKNLTIDSTDNNTAAFIVLVRQKNVQIQRWENINALKSDVSVMFNVETKVELPQKNFVSTWLIPFVYVLGGILIGILIAVVASYCSGISCRVKKLEEASAAEQSAKDVPPPPTVTRYERITTEVDGNEAADDDDDIDERSDRISANQRHSGKRFAAGMDVVETPNDEQPKITATFKPTCMGDNDCEKAEDVPRPKGAWWPVVHQFPPWNTNASGRLRRMVDAFRRQCAEEQLTLPPI